MQWWMKLQGKNLLLLRPRLNKSENLLFVSIFRCKLLIVTLNYILSKRVKLGIQWKLNFVIFTGLQEKLGFQDDHTFYLFKVIYVFVYY